MVCFHQMKTDYFFGGNLKLCVFKLHLPGGGGGGAVVFHF